MRRCSHRRETRSSPEQVHGRRFTHKGGCVRGWHIDKLQSNISGAVRGVCVFWEITAATIRSH